MAACERSSREWLNTMTGEVSDRVEEKGMGTSPMIIQGPSAVHQSRGFSVSLWAHISSGGLIFQDQQEDTDPIHWISVTNGAAASPHTLVLAEQSSVCHHFTKTADFPQSENITEPWIRLL